MWFQIFVLIVIAFISWILFKRRNVSQNVLSADIAANAGGSSGPGEPATPAYDELSLSLQQVISRRDRKNFLDKYYVIDKEDSTPKVRGILFVLNLLAQILKVPKKLYLGHGAFGSVFIAHSKPIGPFRVESEKYAIKKIEVRKAGREANFHNNFTISTRFVVRVLDFWYETTPRRCFRPSTVFLYIKMELCGENLREGIRRLRKSFEEAPSSKVAGRQLAVFILHIFQELLMACFVLHKETRISIVDLKPDNVLFGMRGIKLCDFGLMTFMDRTGVGENRTEPAGGTALYQPCKHVIKSYAGKLDKHAMASILDMYAVGLILLEMFYSMNSRKELEETFGNLKKKRELPKRGMEDEWPEVCKVILNLTQNELHKIYSAQKAIFEFNKLWENDVFRYIHFPDSRIIIKDGTPFLQESVNMWKETFNVMQQCSWRFISGEDKVVESKWSRIFTLAAQEQKDNFFCVSNVSPGIAHIGFLRLKQMVDNNVSYDQIASELKQLYDEKHEKYWHCFVSDDEDTTFKGFRHELVYLRYAGGKKSVEACLCTSRYVGLDKLKERAREIKVIQDKKNIAENSVDNFIKEKFVVFSNKRLENENYGDYNEAFANFLSAELISAYGNRWNCIVGRNIFYCITGQYSGSVLQHTFNGRQVIVFKMKKQPLVQFDHSTYAIICQKFGVPAKWRVNSSDQLPKERLPVEDILRILKTGNIISEITGQKWPDMPLQIMCHHGAESSFNKDTTITLLECDPQFNMSMSIWKTREAEYVQVTGNIGETILRLIKENEPKRIASIIRSYMIENYGGEWFCFVADTNGFQFVIYHNGNLFNFLVGDLEIVLYQPGLEKFKSDYAEGTHPNNVTYDDL